MLAEPEDLAELVGLKERQVRNILDAMAAAGHLQIIQIVDKRHQDHGAMAIE